MVEGFHKYVETADLQSPLCKADQLLYHDGQTRILRVSLWICPPAAISTP
jgi:hypothetical protein